MEANVVASIFFEKMLQKPFKFITELTMTSQMKRKICKTIGG